MAQALPEGWIATQCGAEFADDATLDRLAAALGRAARDAGCGVALFRAGIAPWRDDPGVPARLAARLAPTRCAVLDSVNAWDLAALVAGSRAYAGSSLHGRIVAIAFAVPRVGLATPASDLQAGRQAAFAATWDPDMPGVVLPDGLDGALARARAVPGGRLRALAHDLDARCRQAQETWIALLD